ncbi:HPr family phosphocarrier protein [Candidatus Deferrimicrobium sp.]|uniref:HPr family phosphocarrier protein n=1 Tax=Candidatus Deferrimicrobium sp. TaxID=3060586 RepID=UPI0027256A3B|nr:HPr family phosphocarrier protein [Candidatus Deferrimicrobium sp.]MDO8739041.1 HPr family phosphocarrier protein [Candidatus Deferrimicrobium sp.]
MSAEREFDILNRLGLHARAAAKLVRLANGFASEIRIAKDGIEVNGKSIMGVLMLAAPKDAKILIRANGPDAEEAVAAIGELIAGKFGEE